LNTRNSNLFGESTRSAWSGFVFLVLVVAVTALTGTTQLFVDIHDLRQVVDTRAADDFAGSNVWMLTAPGGISASRCRNLRLLSAVRLAGGVSARDEDQASHATIVRFTGDVPAIVDSDWDPDADVVRGAGERVPVAGIDAALSIPAARTDLFDDAVLVRSRTLRRVEQCFAEIGNDAESVVPLLATLGRDWVSGDVSVSPAFSAHSSSRLVELYRRRITATMPWITFAAMSVAFVGFVFVRRRDIVVYLDVGFRRDQVVVLFSAQLVVGALLGAYVAIATATVRATRSAGISVYDVGRLVFAVAASVAVGLLALTAMCTSLRTSDRRM